MAIPESQFETWSHQGSKAQSAATYDQIRNVLLDPRAPYSDKSFAVFLQGSYGNDTNIYADSDVDIVICLSSIFYSDVTSLPVEDRQLWDANRNPASYRFDDFRKSVLGWLIENFGNGVRSGKKAISIPGSGSRRDVDVLVCVEHSDYYAFKRVGATTYHEGICFWTSDGTEIINYPKQHSENCTYKHGETYSRFKANVRALKNMRNRMIERGYIAEGLAPSYFLEGMLWNVPSGEYNASFQQTFQNYLDWLAKCDSSRLTTASGRHWLLRDGSPVSWRLANFREFLVSARKFYNQGL